MDSAKNRQHEREQDRELIANYFLAGGWTRGECTTLDDPWPFDVKVTAVDHDCCDVSVSHVVAGVLLQERRRYDAPLDDAFRDAVRAFSGLSGSHRMWYVDMLHPEDVHGPAWVHHDLRRLAELADRAIGPHLFFRRDGVWIAATLERDPLALQYWGPLYIVEWRYVSAGSAVSHTNMNTFINALENGEV